MHSHFSLNWPRVHFPLRNSVSHCEYHSVTNVRSVPISSLNIISNASTLVQLIQHYKHFIKVNKPRSEEMNCSLLLM